MQISRFAALVLLLSTAVAMGQNNSAENAADVQTDEAQEDDHQGTVKKPEVPPRFIPKEKISPDQVISFPADI